MTTTENVTKDKMRDLQTQLKQLRLNKAKVISHTYVTHILCPNLQPDPN